MQGVTPMQVGVHWKQVLVNSACFPIDQYCRRRRPLIFSLPEWSARARSLCLNHSPKQARLEPPAIFWID